MFRAVVGTINDLGIWRDVVRPFLAARVAPADIVWSQGSDQSGLFEDGAAPVGAAPVRVPKTFMTAARIALCHRDPARFDLLYRLAFRLQEAPDLLGIASDRDVGTLERMSKAVRRDSHKMKAFVRFRARDDTNANFAAWFEPEHYTLELTAPFFAERFAAMDWAILTPYRSAIWDGDVITFGAGADKRDVPDEDALEEAWRTYYASIFNPARLKTSAMRAEMPRKYWRNLPEAALIGGLVRNAQNREAAMIAAHASQPPSRHLRQAERAGTKVPTGASEVTSLDALGGEIHACKRCPLYQNATQPVLGSGTAKAQMMLVGEQPGDAEDLSGTVFVGPAGKVLDEALDRIGLEREKLYITNAVKHFKFSPRGKRRLHQNPNGKEIEACKFWLDHEVELVDPLVIVALGASAARSVLGVSRPLAQLRNKAWSRGDGRVVFVTYHPSYILRIPDAQATQQAMAAMVADLTAAARHLQSASGARTALDTAPRAP